MTHAFPQLGQAHLAHGPDALLPGKLYLGKGTVLHLRGWCYSQDARLQSLAVLVGNAVTPVSHHSWGRTDVFLEQCPAHDRSGNSLLSGFECTMSFPSAVVDREEDVVLRATLENGQTIDRPLGRIRLCAGHHALPTAVNWPGEGPRVAICMATFRPPI